MLAEKLGEKFEGFQLSLPTEAQWEYACRAGTQTPIYDGDYEILGESNAPALDPIAWYGGNCGRDFDLENGIDISGWAEKQFDDERGGTRKVKIKAPNPHGLYDMLGNVLEWCSDWYADYDPEITTDPKGPSSQSGSYGRVVRGGCWYELRQVRPFRVSLLLRSVVSVQPTSVSVAIFSSPNKRVDWRCERGTSEHNNQRTQ